MVFVPLLLCTLALQTHTHQFYMKRHHASPIRMLDRLSFLDSGNLLCCRHSLDVYHILWTSRNHRSVPVLCRSQTHSPTLNPSEWSQEIFTLDEFELLNRGLNFSVKPTKVPHIDAIADIESSIQHKSIDIQKYENWYLFIIIENELSFFDVDHIGPSFLRSIFSIRFYSFEFLTCWSSSAYIEPSIIIRFE